MNKRKNLVVAASLVATLTLGSVAIVEAQRMGDSELFAMQRRQTRPLRYRQNAVTLRFHRVAQIDNLDQGDQLGADRADFFAQVWVNGQLYTTKNFSRDDGNPGWVIRAPFSGNVANIRVRLLDDDGGLEEKDDHVDINPRGGVKDLSFTYNANTGRVSGDVRSTRGRWITSVGAGDDDNGRIAFSVR